MWCERDCSFEHLLAILGLVHFVAAALKDRPQQFTTARCVIGDENPYR